MVLGYAFDECMKGDLEKVREIIKKDGHLNACNFHGITNMHYACMGGHLDVVKFFIDSGVDPNEIILNAYKVESYSYLYVACSHGHKEVIKYLIEKGANIYHIQNNGYDCVINTLFKCCKLNDMSLIDFLVDECEIDLKHKSKNGTSYMMHAFTLGSFKMVEYLIKKDNFDLTFFTEKNDDGYDCIKHLLHSKNCELSCFNFLVSKLPKNSISDVLHEQNSEGLNCLHRACVRCKNINLIESFINEYCMDINLKSKNGLTCLTMACYGQNFDVIKYLIEVKNMSVNDKDNEGDTCFIWAVWTKNLEIIDYLLLHGANIHDKNHEGDSCIQIAYSLQDYDLIDYFVKKGCDINNINNNGESCLSLAIEQSWAIINGHDSKRFIEYALKNNIDVNSSHINKILKKYSNTLGGKKVLRYKYLKEQNYHKYYKISYQKVGYFYPNSSQNTCSICFEPNVEVKTKCDHVYCNKCYTNYYNFDKDHRCAVCRSEIDNEIIYVINKSIGVLNSLLTGRKNNF